MRWRQNLIVQIFLLAAFVLLGTLTANIDGGSIEGGAEMNGIVFFDHLDAGAAVFGNLADVCALHEAQTDIGVA
jgi:hypothetical protein